jgi:H+/Cl- antiporter ClcA
MVKKYFIFLVFTVSIGGVVGRFHPMVERGDATGAWFFKY